MANPPTLISLPDACVRLRQSHSVVYRLVLAGKIRSRRSGHRWMLVAEDVEHLRREQAPPHGTAA